MSWSSRIGPIRLATTIRPTRPTMLDRPIRPTRRAAPAELIPSAVAKGTMKAKATKSPIDIRIEDANRDRKRGSARVRAAILRAPARVRTGGARGAGRIDDGQPGDEEAHRADAGDHHIGPPPAVVGDDRLGQGAEHEGADPVADRGHGHPGRRYPGPAGIDEGVGRRRRRASFPTDPR